MDALLEVMELQAGGTALAASLAIAHTLHAEGTRIWDELEWIATRA